MRLSALAAIVFGIAGVAILLGLGVWQVQRLTWKEGLIAQLEARLGAEPVVLPEAPDPDADAYLRVQVTGAVGVPALYVLTSVKPYGPGFRVIAPLTTTEGRRILVDLGFVRHEGKDQWEVPGGETGGETGGEVTVIGALYWPNETDGFTPEPDRDGNIWFARDLPLMAEALQTDLIMVIAESHGSGDWPRPRRLGINLPNDHLQYAITWFSLALIWAVMSVLLVRREMQR